MSTSEIKRRDAAKTREAIRNAAQRHFTEHGFEASGVREIAADVGVNVAMVNRYFESKEGLFWEAVIEEYNIDDLIDGERSTFGLRVALIAATKELGGPPFDPTAAFVRSIGSPIVGPLLSELIDSKLIPKLAAWLGGKDPEQRAALIFSELLGFEMLKRMARLNHLDSEHQEKIVNRFARSLQAYVDDV